MTFSEKKAPSAFASWLSDGEKYALIGLSVKTEGDIPSGRLTDNLFALADAAFEIPAHWREWLGTIRAGELEQCDLLLLSKMASAAPDILDEENHRLERFVWHFYIGLLLSSTFAPAHKPVMLSGSRRGSEIDIREQKDIDTPVPCVFRPYPPVFPDDVIRAAQLGECLLALTSAPIGGGHWRLFRTLHVYVEARSTGDILDRLHQYCRCIDGLIVPAPGETKRQFKSRTELFIGPRHHDLMGEMYDVRSAVEHLHENRYLEGFDRDVRLNLLRMEAVAEHIARVALARIAGTSSLWPHFANTQALGAFWALSPDERQRIWGDAFDPLEALREFDPQHIHNGLLGQ